MPHIGKEFNLKAIELSWVITSFLLATAVFLLPIGRWADINGIYKTYKIGIVIFTLASFACGWVENGFWFIIFRFLQGIGAAFINATGTAILVASFPPHLKGRVLGISVSGVYLGLATGPFLGGMIIQYLGWRFLFHLSTLTGIIVFYLALRVFKLLIHGEYRAKGTFKFFDSFVYMLGLILLVMGSSQIPHFWGWVLLFLGVLILIFFWFLEQQNDNPLFDTRLFSHNRLFAFSNLAALINYSATYSLVFIMSLYLQKIKGLSPRDTGSILIAQPLMMTLFSPIMGKLSDKIQPNILASIGMLLCALGLLALSFLTTSSPIIVIVVILIGMGLGFALFSSPNMNTIMSSVDKNQYGIASATASTMRVVGQITSMVLITIFISFLIGNKILDAIPNPEFLKFLHISFIIFSLLCFIGIYFSYFRGKLHFNI